MTKKSYKRKRDDNEVKAEHLQKMKIYLKKIDKLINKNNNGTI